MTIDSPGFIATQHLEDHRATMSCRAAENHFWVNNSTARPSCWSSFTIRPDGQVMGRLQLHKPGLLLTDMVLDPSFFDAPGPWRDAAMNGQLRSGDLWMAHVRRTCL